MGKLLEQHLAHLEDTRALAQTLRSLLPWGARMVLQGPLGSGKTTLVRFLVEALGFQGRVTSPTYTLIHTYPTPEGPVVHADLYRLEDPEGFLPELEAAAEGARLTLVEWGDPEALRAGFLVRLRLEGEGRHAELYALGGNP